MHPSTTRTFTPSRIVALALIALVAGGLAFLHFSAGADPVSVPTGAQAGDLILERCDYATEDGSYAADCGTLVVPENRADAQSRLIALPVTRIRARSGNPGEPVFRLEGGPGKTNMQFPMASRFADRHDVVLVGYRGVDGSVRLDCPEVESALKHSKDLLGEESFRAYGDAYRTCAERLTDEGVDLSGYNLTQRVDDIEAARKALGYGRVNLVSESAGTRYAMVYAWRYPRSIHRSVLIAVNPPGHFLWDAKTTNEQIARYSHYCEDDESCSERTDDLAATMRGTDIPDRWMGLPIKEGNARLVSFWGLMETTPESDPLSAPITLSSWTSADDGDAGGFWFQSLLADLAFPKSFVWGELAAMGQADARAAERYYSAGKHHPGTDFIWGGGELVGAWPASPDDARWDRVRTSEVETLVVNGELDFSTPPQVATEELLPYLPNGKEVVLQGFGHSTTFWTEQREAGTRLINAYLDTGRVDRSLYEPQPVDFTPEVTQTALAKGIAGAMGGLALLTILSLVWMAFRVALMGSYGRKASATLRAGYAVVLGLGGWLLGALIVITTMPGTPLDHELLAVLAVGVPAGLGIYLAWVQRGSSATTKTAGFVAALAGALAGAYLGFHATSDLLALVTAIAGAVAGGNLLLILFDMAQVPRATVDTRRGLLEPAAPAGAPGR